MIELSHKQTSKMSRSKSDARRHARQRRTNIFSEKRASIQRTNIRRLLFSGESTNGKKLNQKHWLVPNWSVYIKHNFELPKPGHAKAITELRELVTKLQTPDYNAVYKQTGKQANIPPRKLGNLELAKLQELLPIYEAKLNAISHVQDVSNNIKKRIYEHRVVNLTQTENKVNNRELPKLQELFPNYEAKIKTISQVQNICSSLKKHHYEPCVLDFAQTADDSLSHSFTAHTKLLNEIICNQNIAKQKKHSLS